MSTDEPRILVRVRFCERDYPTNRILALAGAIEEGELDDPKDRAFGANALRAIIGGSPAQKALGLAQRGGQPKTRLHRWIAIDYWLRKSFGHKKVGAAVAVDWHQKSPSTVEDIKRRYRDVAEELVAHWSKRDFPFVLCEAAVADAREQLLTDTILPLGEYPEPTTPIVFDIGIGIAGPFFRDV